MATPYKMKNSMLQMAAKGGPLQKNYAGSPLAKHTGDKKKMVDGNTSITDVSQNKTNIAELKEAEKNILSPSDLQASKDTIHQSNIQFMNTNYGDKGPIGVIKRNNIAGSKKAQTNKNITTSGTNLSDAANRSTQRISTSNTAKERTRGNAKEAIATNQATINQRTNLKEGLKKFSPPKPTGKKATIGTKPTNNSNKKIKTQATRYKTAIGRKA